MNFSFLGDFSVATIDSAQGKRLTLLPVYLNCNSYWEVDFARLYEPIANNSEGRNIILLRDFNGRVGEEQKVDILGLEEEVYSRFETGRKSEDKIVNARGKKVLELFEDFGYILLNGRTRGDLQGAITFIGGNGSSVIDLAAEHSQNLIKQFGNVKNS